MISWLNYNDIGMNYNDISINYDDILIKLHWYLD